MGSDLSTSPAIPIYAHWTIPYVFAQFIVMNMKPTLYLQSVIV